MTDLRKAAFDSARRADPDNRLTAEDVDKINSALDAAGVPDSRVAPDAPGAAETPEVPHRVGHEGIELIKRFEGCARVRADGKVEAYPDPGTGGAPWTIGWGHTGPEVKRGTVWTQDDCDRMLSLDLVRYSDDVVRALGDAHAATGQAQFDALVSFHYNTGAISRATLTRKHKAGDFAGAAREFDRWVNAGGRVMKGLQRRRAAERALYESGS